MKILLIVILTLFISTAWARGEHSYKISGRVQGHNEFKYAILYSSGKRLVKSELTNGTFSISGEVADRNRHGLITIGNIYLVKEDVEANFQYIVPKNVIRRLLILDSEINIVFDLSKRLSYATGGSGLNEIQNVFSNIEENYLIRLDSAHLSISNATGDTKVKMEKKGQAKRVLYLESKRQVLNNILLYPNSEVSLVNFISFAMVPMFPDGQPRKVFNLLSDSLRHSKYGMRLDSMLTGIDAAMVKPNVIGTKMPDFTLADSKGNKIHSLSVYGKYTLIDFWASWCAPCRAENPNLRRVFERFHAKGLQIVSISIDHTKDRLKWLAAIETDKTQEFINLFDPSDVASISKTLKINSIPANYLIDANGTIIYTDLRGDDLDKKLVELLN